MSNSVKNEGIVGLNEIQGINPDENRTVVVMGISRSGTSMTALVLDALGVFMGSEKKDASFEDHEVFGALEKNSNTDLFKELVQERNKKYTTWGWKRPDAITYVNKFEPLISRPHYIIMFRDHLAISMRNMIANDTDAVTNLDIAQKRFNKIINFIKSTKHPLLLVSYEKAIQNPETFIENLIRFLQINPLTESKKKALQIIQPDSPSYLASVARNKKGDTLIGHLDKGSSSEIKGWAINKNDKTKPVHLDIYINGELFTTTKADQFRQDLKDQFRSSGNHAFNISISPDMANSNIITEIDIKFANSDHSLHNCPLQIKNN